MTAPQAEKQDNMTSFPSDRRPRCRPRHRRRDAALVVMVTVMVVVGLPTVTLSMISNWISTSEGSQEVGNTHTGRRLLEDPGKLNCTPRAIHNFPADFMSAEQRARGGVTVHIVLALYVFAALAIVCDDYFVASLEQISDALSLQPDVAGATFMAAGSSAPELFTAVVGVFFAQSDVGVGTIVGSAVFNLLFINAICSLFAGMVVYLAWWPLFRDLTAYSLSVLALILIMADGVVHWYEALALVLMYAAYCLLMFFNRRLGDSVMNAVDTWWEARATKRDKVTVVDTDEAGSRTPLIASSGSHKSADVTSGVYGSSGPSSSDQTRSASVGGSDADDKVTLSVTLISHVEVTQEDEYISPLTPPTDGCRKLLWLMTLPLSLAFMLTIPDCRRPGCWRRSFGLTFIMSIVWIAGLSYFMVWMVTIAGDTLGIPDTVMGLTLLAAGTSVPDAMASLIVVRQGEGDMAVSNSIGSNVFDVLLCLGLPWLLRTAFVTPGSSVAIDSKGLSYSSITLLATVAFLLLALFINRWRLTRGLGIICLFVYAVVITFSCLYELNVFGYLNPPPCPT